MENFVVRKRRREANEGLAKDGESDSTDVKLSLLASLHPDLELDSDTLLEALLASNGSVENASALLAEQARKPLGVKRKKFSSTALDRQASLAHFNIGDAETMSKSAKLLTRRGRTLHLYHPKDVEEHTPCSIIHNFLPPDEADALLRELLEESPTFERMRFKLFEKVVESPHTASFYVDSMTEVERQKSEFFYNGRKIDDVRQTLPLMLKTSSRVRAAVNAEVQRRIKERYPGGEKLKYQSPDEWQPNCSFVNCYDGGQESVGFHTDQLTYLGPRAIIGSLSLGVAREFRVRKIVAQDGEDDSEEKTADSDTAQSLKNSPTKLDRADQQGQIAIHLPHNSLLVMHAEMQEEWKHSIAPARSIDPHPVAGGKRLNVTYRCYKEHLHPKYTPRCKCGIPCVLRCVQRKKDNRGRYMWSCHSHYSPGEKGCSYFEWGEFDDDGKPPWVKKDEKPTTETVDSKSTEIQASETKR